MPLALASQRMESSDFPHPVNAHADSVGFKLAVEPAVALSTSATFTWMDAWSLAPMMQLLAEHFHCTYRPTNSPVSFCMLTAHLVAP